LGETLRLQKKWWQKPKQTWRIPLLLAWKKKLLIGFYVSCFVPGGRRECGQQRSRGFGEETRKKYENLASEWSWAWETFKVAKSLKGFLKT